MMRIVTAVLLIGLVVAPAARAKPPAPSRFSLAQAQCWAPPAAPAPCSPAFRFASGAAALRRARQPKPTCPRTGEPTEVPGADVKLSGVTRNGAAFTGTLQGIVEFRTSFGPDPNGNCALAAVQIETPSLLGAVACRAGRCKGQLFPLECLPKNCADTPLTTELTAFTVMDDAGLPLAVPGTALAPAANDAP